MKKIYGFFPVHRAVRTYRLAMFFLRHPRSLEVSAWEHKQIKQRNLCMLWGWCYSFFFCILSYWVVSVIFACSWICIFEQCSYAAAASIPVSIPDKFYSIKFAPWFQTSSWFRSFCRTRFQKGWTSAAELDDNVFAFKLSNRPGRLELRLWPKRDAQSFGSRLRVGCKPPRECQYESYSFVGFKTQHRVSGA